MTLSVFRSYALAALLTVAICGIIAGFMYLPTGTYKRYDFSDTYQEFAWGRVHAHIAGTFQKNDSGIEILTSPYTLYLSPSLNAAPTGDACTADLKSLEVKSNESGEVLFKVTDVSGTFALDDKFYRTFYSFPLGVLKYTDYIIDADVFVKNCTDLSSTDHIHLLVKKNYQEGTSRILDQ